MKTAILFKILVMVGMLAFCQVAGVGAQDDPFAELQDKGLDEELAWLQAEKFAITASRVLENIKKSAASITVITDKEIEQMGARTLMDVLQTVPGISVWDYTDGIYKIDARGVFKSVGQHILLMINSHPVNENYLGGIASLDTLMVDNVKQIEVIRGPGSALYGANAFGGVINVITKDAATDPGVRVKASGGSYQTQHYNAFIGHAFADLHLTLNVNYYATDGFKAPIAQDSQSLMDLLLRTRASLAPGTAQAAEEKYDIAVGLQYKGLKIDARYIDNDTNRPISVGNALTQYNKNPSIDYYINLTYEHTLWDVLNLTGKIYHNLHDFNSDYQALPPGSMLPTLPPQNFALFPEGALVKFGNKNTRTGAELQTRYKLGETHTVVGGLTYENMDQSDVTYAANFLYTSVENVVIPLSAVQDLSDPQHNSNKAVSRTFTAAFLEDLWDLNDALRFTIGARYDHYSDFGGSFNPRAGAIWEFIPNYDLKVLYGRAFRAPSFYELYSQNNPSFIGNPDLKPEVINTYEISLGAKITHALQTRATVFRNDIKDSVDLVTVQQGGFSQRVFQNKNKLRSQGVEVELIYDFGKGIYLGANYTYQEGKNLDTDEGFWYNPTHKGNVMANVRLSKNFNWYTNLYVEGARERAADDPREAPEGFAVVNTTLIAKKFLEGLEVRVSVYNLLDHDYAIPTVADSLPVDYLMPGRSFMVEARYSF